jgi:phosphate-selective porin OprO and OprP
LRALYGSALSLLSELILRLDSRTTHTSGEFNMVSYVSALLVVLSFATSAAAQSLPPAPAPTSGFQDGFFVQTPDGANRLLFGFVAQTDGRFSVDDPTPITNTFTMRKVRPTMSGRIAWYFDFKVMPDFGNGTATILDAYFDIRFSPKLRVRSGKDKTPVGYELLIGDAYLLFPERSLASSLVPNRDVGFQALGDLSPKFSYAAGLFNGTADGVSSTTDVDGNNGKDLAARVVVQPFRSGANNGAALSGLGFQVGGSSGKQAGVLPTFRTSVGQSFFSYAAGTVASGTRTRVTPSLFYYYKSLGVFAEYVRSRQRATRATATREFTNTAWDVTASFLVTGENAGVGYTRPRSPFDPAAGTWGALQLVTRYAALNLDDEIFASGFAAASSADTAKQFTVGVNWYPVAYVKYYATYERTRFDRGTVPARSVEHVILFRVQLGI